MLLGIKLKLPRESPGQPIDAITADLHDEVHILRCTRNAIDHRCDRPR
jgi:hypothetical protein